MSSQVTLTAETPKDAERDPHRPGLHGVSVGEMGQGSRRLAAEFGIVLGIQPSDLTALAGLDIPGSTPTAAAADMAELIWEARRLTSSQVRQLTDVAKSMGI
jgi:hypothetical protein